MQIDELTLVLLGAFWTGTTAVFTGMQMADAARDRIMLAKADDVHLPPDYRRHLLWYTWVPLRVSLASVSLLLGVIIVFLPKLATEAGTTSRPTFAAICVWSAFIPFSGAALFFITSLLEFSTMKSRIHDAGRKNKT